MRVKKILNLFIFSVILLIVLPFFSLSKDIEKPKIDAPPWEYLYYFYKVFIGLAVIATLMGLILAGVNFLTSVGEPGRLSDAKDQAIKALLGLFIVIFIPTIFSIITNDHNFKITNIFKPISFPVKIKIDDISLSKTPGVYVTTTDGKIHYLLQSCSQLPLELNGKIEKVEVVEEVLKTEVVASWGVILFEEPNFKGYCLSLSNGPSTFAPFGSSILIYRKNLSKDSNKGTVTFYRKAFYNEKGGTYKKNGVTGWEKLEGWKFDGKNGVGAPEDEKKCIEWKNNGSCKTLENPTLKETTSIKIEGNLSVLLAGREKKGKIRGPYCQLFYDKGGSYSVANLKNEYIRAKDREPSWMKILPGTP